VRHRGLVWIDRVEQCGEDGDVCAPTPWQSLGQQAAHDQADAETGEYDDSQVISPIPDSES
jgi:hypothetical protein